MNNDTVKGTMKKAEGAVQETGGKMRAAVDHAVGDKKGEAQGVKDQVSGSSKKVEGAAQQKYGQVKDAIKDAANS